MPSNTQADLDARLSFMRLDGEALAHLGRAKAAVQERLPHGLDVFYAQLMAFPETARFFRDQGHVTSARSRQLKHWEMISDGQFDARYVQGVTKVGETHARIGLEPRWYIGGYALLLEQLIAAVVEARWPGGAFGRRAPGAGELAGELGALAKATFLDMDYAISVYLEAAEAARRTAEAEVLAQERAAVASSVGAGMSALASGDLTYRMPADMPAEYEAIREDFNAAAAELERTLTQVSGAAASIGASADEMANASDNLSRRTEQQAAGLEQTAAALDEITATVRATADGAEQASAAVAEAKEEAQRSGQVVREAVQAMGQIEDSSRTISQIIGVIDEIAFQTNLLALNAGVEAARAGDAGRGFAVVASEVRALAQRSAAAAKDIKALISTSSEQVGHGVTLVRESGALLEAIVQKVAEIDGVICAIASAAREQAAGLAEVNVAVNQMDQVVQQNAVLVQQSSAAAQVLKGEGGDLLEAIGRFRMAAEPPARREPVHPTAARALQYGLAANLRRAAV